MKKSSMCTAVMCLIDETGAINERFGDFRSSFIVGKNADYYIRKDKSSYELYACNKDNDEEFEIASFCSSLISIVTLVNEIAACIEIIEEDDIWTE